MGCAGIVALTLPGDPLQAVHPPLAQPSPAARGLRRRLSGEATGRLPTCPRRWAERAAAGEGPTARLFGAPTWVGGVNQDSGKWQRRGPKHRQATDWCPAPPGEIRTSFGVQALPGAGTVATCIGPPQPNASAVNGLSTAENLPWGKQADRLPCTAPGRKRQSTGRTPRRWRATRVVAMARKVLECGSPLPLSQDASFSGASALHGS